MLNPITVWQSDEGLILVAGFHRLEAVMLNGGTTIMAKVSQAKTLEDAKILETSENLLRNELAKLDRAQHLSELKEAYEAKHPEIKGGVAGAMAKHGSATGIIPFTEDAAEKTGLSDSAVFKAVAMWRGLSDASKATIKGTWLADHQAGLMQLADLTAARQSKALKMMFPAQGKQAKATNVADAVYLLDNSRLPTSVEKRFSGLSKSIKAMEPEELHAVLDANEDLITAWYEARFGGAK